MVALVVIGPERLPEVARAGGQWIGRMQRFFRSVKSDVSQELSLQEYYKLHNKVLEDAKVAGQAVEAEARRLELAMLEGLQQEKQKSASAASQDVNAVK